MSASRRMWSRRVLRAGWLVAPIFAFPGVVYRGTRDGLRRFFFNRCGKFDWANVGLILMVGLFFGVFSLAMAWTVRQTTKYQDDATASELKAASANTCVASDLQAQLKKGSAVKRFDIEVAESKCKDIMVVEKQKQLLGVK